MKYVILQELSMYLRQVIPIRIETKEKKNLNVIKLI